MSPTTDALPVSPQISFLDVNDPAFSFHSPDVALAQTQNWYANSPVGPLILRHAECQELLRDRRLRNGGKVYMEMCGIFDGPIYDWLVPMIANQYGDDHNRLRGLINKTFTPRMIEGLRPFIRTQAERLAEEFASVEVCDFVEDFANPLPLVVMSELLGIPAEDYDTFRTWSTDIGLVFGLAHGGDIASRVETAVVGLYGYVDSLMKDKQARPTDDLISALVVAQHSDGSVSREEVLNLIVTLVFAAHDTTRHQLANAMVAFSDHPEQWTLLAQRPTLIEQAVEEVMRWCPSVAATFRFAVEDFDYQGLHVTKGTPLYLCASAAQRDPSAFHHADSFDITVARKTPLLQFGGGPHHCLGTSLARAETGEALSVLSRRMGPPSITGPVSWRPPIGIYGPNELPLRFG